ncbi:MAG: hypothetical protein ACP5D6_08260 [Kosmotogaceae bacterium]
MILGMSHIALSVADIDQKKKQLEKRGFNNIFVEKNIINHPTKKHLLKTYQSTHEIALFYHPELNQSVEIINHGYVDYDRKGNFNLKNDHIELSICEESFDKEQNFWLEVLSFKKTSKNRLVFSSAVPSWSCTIELIEKPKIQPAMLDSQGYPCLALLTNSLERDLSIASQLGAYDLTEIFELDINNRALKISMFRTPGSAICELIQPKG